MDDKQTPSSPSSSRVAAIQAETRRILSARGEERGYLLLDSDQIHAVVPCIPPEELMLTLRIMGRTHAAQILEYARPSQVRFLLDLELWKKDEVQADRAAFWVRLLADTGDKALTRWLLLLEEPDLAALFAKVVRVTHADDEGMPEKDDVTGETSFTLDGFTYFTVADAVEPAVRRAMTLLHHGAREKYAHLVEMLLTGFDAEKEETAYQLRSTRIAERGFVDFEEAQAVYDTLTPEQFARTEPRAEGTLAAHAEEEEFNAPAYPMVVEPRGGQVLREVLERFAGTEDAEALMAQLARLTNKVIAADGLDPAEAESFSQAALKVAGYISIGLELLYAGDLDRMTHAVGRHWLEHLFQVGWGRVAALTKRARTLLKTGWPQGKMERLLLLDPPLPDILNGIYRARPQWLHVSPRLEELHDFRSLREVELAERVVDKTDFLGRYLISVISFRLGDLQQAGSRLEDENLKGSTVFLTALANASLGRSFSFAPVAKDELADALKNIWDRERPPRKVKPELFEAALHWSENLMVLTDKEREFLREFLSDSIALLEEQFGHLPAGELPDPRFLRGIWIE